MAYENRTQSVFFGEQLYGRNQLVEDSPLFVLPGSDIDGNSDMIPISEQLMSRHMLMLGGIGMGKTNALNLMLKNVLNQITDRDTVIIFDTKGDFYNDFYCPGDVVISNDGRATNGEADDYWNLFGEITIDGRIEENVVEIAKTLFADKLTNTTQPFFPNAAKDIFSAVLLHILRSEGSDSFRNNRALREVFDSFTVDDMKGILKSHPDLKAMTAYIEDESSGQTMGVLAELQQMIREVFIGNFRKSGTLSMRDIVRKKGGRVVFIEYDLGIGEMLTPIYRLLIDLAIKEALCRKQDEGNVYFFIDEFRLLPRLDHIDDGVNFGRSLGAKFIVGIQNIDQIYDAYGENRARSILSGFGCTVAFRVNDSGSREYIKQLYGNNVKLLSYLAAVQSRGVTEQIREGYVVEDVDITTLKVGEAIVCMTQCSPFFFRFKRFVPKRSD